MTATNWLKALERQKLDVKSARNALEVTGYLDTGCYALNWAISGRLLGGYPFGHTVEIFGDPATGKSFLASRAIAMAQDAGGVALLDDVEHAYNEANAARIGINVDDLAVSYSTTVREHLKVTQGFLNAFRDSKQQGPGLLVLDSIAQLSTEHEMKTQLDKRDMTKAAELKAYYRIVGSDLASLPVVHIGTNHSIANIGSMFQQRTTPGGGGPKFMASTRIDLRAVSKIKQGDEPIGVLCRAVIDKARFTAPWKQVQLAIPFNAPISKASGLIPILVSLGVVEARGNFLFYKGEKIGRYYKTKGKFLEQDEVGETLLDMAPEVLEEADAEIAAGRSVQSTMELDGAEAEDETDGE